MLIKMICGTYGMLDDDIIVAKTNKSAPFEIEEKKGRQLIESGYAEEIKDINVSAENVDSFTMDDNQDGGTGNLSDCSLQDLRKQAKEKGLATTGSKQQLIERIQACENAEESREDEAAPVQSGEEPPILMPAEPEA